MQVKPVSVETQAGYYVGYLYSIQRKLKNRYSLHGAHHRNLNLQIQLPILALPPQSRILDAGCGLSFWIDENIDALYNIHGIDNQKESIEFCRGKFPTRQYKLGDVYQLPYEDEFFDAVVMREVIEHLHDPEKAIAEVHRVLKPHGLYILTTPNYDSLLLHLIEHTYNRFFGGPCKPYLPDVHPSKFRFDALLLLLKKYFRTRNYRTISFGINIVAICSKLPV